MGQPRTRRERVMTKNNDLTVNEVKAIFKAAKIIEEWASAHEESMAGVTALDLGRDVFSFAIDRQCDR